MNGNGSLETISPTLTYYAGSAATGTALSVAPSLAGTYTVVANFAGSADYTSATSTPATFTITQATPTVAVNDAGGTYSGSAFPATATVNGNGSLETISPTLTYYTGSAATGTASFRRSSLTGTYTVVANFAGSADYTSATSTPATFTITQATPTVAVSDAGGTYSGSAFPATATVNGNGSLETISPTLTYYAGSAATGTRPPASSLAGTYTVVANFAGTPITERDVHTGNVDDHSSHADGRGQRCRRNLQRQHLPGDRHGERKQQSRNCEPDANYYGGIAATGTALSAAPSLTGTYTVVANFAGKRPIYTSATSTPATFTITQATPTVAVSDAAALIAVRRSPRLPR